MRSLHYLTPWLLLSMLIHLGGVIMCARSTKPVVHLSSRSNVIKSYVQYTQVIMPIQKLQPSAISSFVTKPSRHKQFKNQLSEAQFRQQSTSHPSLSSRTELSNQDALLLKVLHQRISEQQQYPDDAIAAEQHGRVGIRFDVHPDGRISAVHLMTATGFTSIDQAALKAVRAISPVKEAKLYLKIKKTFSVEVVFAG